VRWWWSRPPCLLKRVIVNVTYEQSEAFEGVLWSWRRGWCTLRDVTALKAGSPQVRIPGDVTLHADKIAYFQVLT